MATTLSHAVPQASARAQSSSAGRPRAALSLSRPTAGSIACSRACSFLSGSSSRLAITSGLVASTKASRSRQLCATVRSSGAVPDGSVSLVLLAGGVGKRMGASMPKQYLPLKGTPICLWSLKTISAMPEVGEVVVVCGEDYREVFEGQQADGVPMKFALPGAERQDSVFNGVSEIADGAKLVAIHDSARPCVTPEEVSRCIADAAEVGAAVLGVKTKATIKRATKDGMVDKTLDRSLLWEMHTPQIIEPAMLLEGFAFVKENNLEVTDDVSIVEHLGKPVRITEGSYNNLKVTTPDDMIIAGLIMDGEGANLVA